MLREFVHVCMKWQGEEEAMFLEYRKELRVIFNNLGALVSHCSVTNMVVIRWGCCELEVESHDWLSTRPSRLIGVGGVNWVGVSRRQFSVVLNILETEQFCPVSSALWTNVWTILDAVSKYDVTIGTTLRIGNCVRTKQDLGPTTFRDWTKLFPYFQSPTVLTCRQFSSHRGRRQDKTRQSCLIGVGGVN